MFKDLIIANRSARGFDPSVKVSATELMEMVDCARLSASSINKQMLKFFIAGDEETAAMLTSETKLGGMLPELHLPTPGTEPPAYICICHDSDIVPDKEMFLKDVGIAAQTITLAAAEMGYSCCMIGNYNPERVAERLGLSANLSVKLIIAIGKSIEKVRIKEISGDEDTAYYRDENGVHIVPKRKLEDVIING